MNAMHEIVKLLLNPEKIKIDSLQLEELREFLKCRSIPYKEDYDANLLKDIFREFIYPREQRKYRSNHFGRLMTAKQREKYGDGGSETTNSLQSMESDVKFWKDDLMISTNEAVHEPMEISQSVDVRKRPHIYLDSEAPHNLNGEMENATCNDLNQSPTPAGHPAKKFKTITYP